MRQFTFFCIILFYGCKGETDQRLLEKEDNIEKFYEFELKKPNPENEIIAIMQTQQCVSCRQDIFLKFYKLLEKSDIKKTFIMASRDSLMISLIKNLPNSNIVYDTNHKLKDYGLNYSADLCLVMKDGRLKKWFEISNDNLEKMHSIE